MSEAPPKLLSARVLESRPLSDDERQQAHECIVLAEKMSAVGAAFDLTSILKGIAAVASFFGVPNVAILISAITDLINYFRNMKPLVVPPLPIPTPGPTPGPIDTITPVPRT